MKKKIIGTLLVTIFSINATTFFGHPDSSDLTYSNNRKPITESQAPAIETSQDVRSVAIQSDGKIVVAGSSIKGANSDFLVVRINPSGTLDNTFGVSGRVVTDIGSSADRATSVVIQADGKIVVGGSSNFRSNSNFTIVRYNVDGSLDRTFSDDGRDIIDIDGHDDGCSALTIQKDRKIIATGHSYNGLDGNFAIIRYNTNGTLDNTFSADGKVTTDFGGNHDAASDVTVQQDGKIVAVGSSSESPIINNYNFAIARYNKNGTLDNTFGTNGKKTKNLSEGLGNIRNSDDYAQSVGIKANGDIVVTGYSESYHNSSRAYENDFAMLYNVGNTPYQRLFYIGRSSKSYSMAIQSDGKIVMAGYYLPSGYNSNFLLTRLTSGGGYDITFGASGNVETNFGNNQNTAYSVAIQRDGKIVAAGYTSSNSSTRYIAIARYQTNGNLDNTFSENGKLVLTIDSYIHENH